MAHTASNLIAQARANFSNDAHSILLTSHGHHFAVHQPKPQLRPPQPRPRAPPSEMMEPVNAVDPEDQLLQKQQKIAAHNARINRINNVKLDAPVDDEETVEQ
jgi:hypothetical protein